MWETLSQNLQGRPKWMNAMMAFCAYMTFIYMPFDLFWKPVADDVEVWFGFMLTGWAAKATEPLHWAIYAALFWGFWRMHPRMHPWAALYVVQVAIGMFLWPVLVQGGFLGLAAGLISGGVFGWIAWVLWNSRALFEGTRDA